MPRVPASVRAATDAKVVAVLAAHMPLPLPTAAVAARADMTEHAAYDYLRRLATEGRVRRHRLDGWRCVFWALPGSVLDD